MHFFALTREAGSGLQYCYLSAELYNIKQRCHSEEAAHRSQEAHEEPCIISSEARNLAKRSKKKRREQLRFDKLFFQFT